MAATNVYQMVTDRIIEELGKGFIPWHKPWHGTLNGAISYVTRKPYSFLNQLLLGDPGEYLTFKQIQNLGGSIKKGAKSRFVVFYKMLESVKITTHPTTGEEMEKKEQVPVLRYYNVFHLKDVDGIESKLGAPIPCPHEPIETAECIVNDYVEREHLLFESKSSNEASYCPSLDYVVVPLLEQFESAEEYYSTTFHELVHSTGHKSRCDRHIAMVAKHGSDNYSKEELTAEIGSAMLCNISELDISKCFDNSVSYIGGWLSRLRDDNRLIVHAAARAEKAVKYILNEKDC